MVHIYQLEIILVLFYQVSEEKGGQRFQNCLNFKIFSNVGLKGGGVIKYNFFPKLKMEQIILEEGTVKNFNEFLQFFQYSL